MVLDGIKFASNIFSNKAHKVDNINNKFICLLYESLKENLVKSTGGRIGIWIYTGASAGFKTETIETI